MSSRMDRERQFDDILDAAEGDADALRDAAQRARRHDPELGAYLGLTAQLSAVKPPRAELSAARLRVGQRLSSAILAGEGETAARTEPQRQLRHSEPELFQPGGVNTYTAHERASAEEAPTISVASGPPLMTPLVRSSLNRAQRWITMGALVAAALVICIGGLTALSASSLPESPLYGFKRAEETTLLTLPLDHVTQSNVLSMIALRRLAEAQSESEEKRDNRAIELVHEFNTNVKQMIANAMSVQNNAASRHAITQQIADVLQEQRDVRQAAITRGDTTFTQTLTASQTTIQASLQQNHVTLPPPDNNAVNGSPTSGTTPAPGGPTTGATPGPGTPIPTHTPAATCTPGSSHGKGNGNGDGSNNCNPTPTSRPGG